MEKNVHKHCACSCVAACMCVRCVGLWSSDSPPGYIISQVLSFFIFWDKFSVACSSPRRLAAISWDRAVSLTPLLRLPQCVTSPSLLMWILVMNSVLVPAWQILYKMGHLPSSQQKCFYCSWLIPYAAKAICPSLGHVGSDLMLVNPLSTLWGCSKFSWYILGKEQFLNGSLVFQSLRSLMDMS